MKYKRAIKQILLGAAMVMGVFPVLVPYGLLNQPQILQILAEHNFI